MDNYALFFSPSKGLHPWWPFSFFRNHVITTFTHCKRISSQFFFVSTFYKQMNPNKIRKTEHPKNSNVYNLNKRTWIQQKFHEKIAYSSKLRLGTES